MTRTLPLSCQFIQTGFLPISGNWGIVLLVVWWLWCARFVVSTRISALLPWFMLMPSVWRSRLRSYYTISLVLLKTESVIINTGTLAQLLLELSPAILRAGEANVLHNLLGRPLSSAFCLRSMTSIIRTGGDLVRDRGSSTVSTQFIECYRGRTLIFHSGGRSVRSTEAYITRESLRSLCLSESLAAYRFSLR